MFHFNALRTITQFCPFSRLAGIPYGLDKSMFPYPGSNIRDDFLSRLYDQQGLPLSLGDLYHGRIPSLGADGLLAAAAASFPGVVPGFPSPFNLGLPRPPGVGFSMQGHEHDNGGRDSPSSSMESSPSARDEANALEDRSPLQPITPFPLSAENEGKKESS